MRCVHLGECSACAAHHHLAIERRLHSPWQALEQRDSERVLEFGQLLFTRWALPFEIASIVLLVALVGAVWWAGSDPE